MKFVQCRIRGRATHFCVTVTLRSLGDDRKTICRVRSVRGSPRQSAEVDGALARRPSLEVKDKRRHYCEAQLAVRLLDIDVAAEGLPAARLIKFEIVRFAKQERELRGIVIAHGLHGGVERDAGIAATSVIGPGRNPADASDVNASAIPAYPAKENTDMACKTAVGRLDHHAQIGIGPFDVAP